MYVRDYAPSAKRAAFAEGGVERRMYEAAVMIAVARYLIEQQHFHGQPGSVFIHPDGQHDAQFSFVDCLRMIKFERVEAMGRTKFGGRYVSGEDEIVVFPKSGLGDVTADVGGRRVIAECKGGTLNSRHAGIQSRARTSLSELIGQLMVLSDDGSRQIAVRPWSRQSQDLAERLAPRCAKVGIEIALVHEEGSLHFV